MGLSSITIIGAGAVGTSYSQIINGAILYGRKKDPPFFNGRKIENYSNKKEIISSAKTIFFCIKAYDLYNAIKEYREIIDEKAVIVLIANGMYHHIFHKRLLRNRVNIWAGFSTLAATRKGRKIELIEKGKLWLAPLSIGAIKPYIPGIEYNIGDYDELSWKKGIINMLINPLCTENEVKNGELLNNSELRKKFLEKYEALKKISFKVGKNMPTLEEVKEIIASTSENICSSLQDKINNRPSEMKYFSRYFEKLSRKE